MIFDFLLLGVPRHGRVGLCRGVRPSIDGQHRNARSLPIPNAETRLIAICLDLRPLCQVKSLLGNTETAGTLIPTTASRQMVRTSLFAVLAVWN